VGVDVSGNTLNTQISKLEFDREMAQVYVEIAKNKNDQVDFWMGFLSVFFVVVGVVITALLAAVGFLAYKKWLGEFVDQARKSLAKIEEHAGKAKSFADGIEEMTDTIRKRVSRNVPDLGGVEPQNSEESQEATEQHFVQSAETQTVVAPAPAAQKIQTELVQKALDAKAKSAEMAIPIWEELIALNPEPTRPYFEIGSAFLKGASAAKAKDEKLKKFEAAVVWFKKVIDRDPILVLNNLGNALVGIVKNSKGAASEAALAEALLIFERLVALRPEHKKAWFNWGNALSVKALELTEKGKFEEAKQTYLLANEKFRRAVEVSPDSFASLSNWANSITALARLLTGDDATVMIDRALEKINEAIEIAPNEARLYGQRALIFFEKAAKLPQNRGSLLEAAEESIQKSIGLDRTKWYHWGLWSLILSNLAELRNVDEKQKMENSSREKMVIANALRGEKA
jgi:tetratricopeptide (TPR) repeat protein